MTDLRPTKLVVIVRQISFRMVVGQFVISDVADLATRTIVNVGCLAKLALDKFVDLFGSAVVAINDDAKVVRRTTDVSGLGRVMSVSVGCQRAAADPLLVSWMSHWRCDHCM